MNRFLLALLLGSNIFIAQSQSIFSGFVAGDKGPLAGASVRLLKTSFVTYTDSTGHFIWENIPAGRYQLKVSFVGYENHQQEVLLDGQDFSVQVTLVPLVSTLSELVVTGSLREVRKSESVQNVDVYNASFFQRNPTSNVFDALSMVNGLFPDVDNGVSNTTDVQINGLEGNYSMILIDGVPSMNGLAGYYAMNALPMSIVDKVEVLKGASSAVYGSDAIAGVINIKTKKPSAAPRFSANVMLSSMLEANTDFTASFKAGKAHSLFTVSTENFNTKWDIDKDNFTDIPLINRVNVFNKWSAEGKKSSAITVYGRYLFESRYGGQKQFTFNRRGSSQVYGEVITTHQWQTGLSYKLPGKENFLLMADYSGHQQIAFFGANSYDGLQQNAFTQFTWNKRIDKVNELLIGASYRLYHFQDNSPLTTADLNGIEPIVHTAGVFFEDDISFLHYHRLILGARFDYTTRGKSIVTPRLNYRWNSKNEKNILRIGAGTGYRFPNLLNEGFGAINGSRTIEIPEPLKPESAVNVTTSYMRIQPFKTGLLTLDVGFYYTRFFNYIDPDYDEDPAVIVYSNSDLGATSWGFNFYSEINFNFPLKVGTGFTYNNMFEVELDNGEKENERPPHTPDLVANYYLSYNFPVPQLSIDLTGTIVSPMVLSTVPGDERPEKSPWYTIQNIQMTKKFRRGFELYLGLKNFFNFIQKEPILRPFDPFNRFTDVDNPNNYRFDTTYGFTTTRGITGFVGFRFVFNKND